jgi:[ribosomal protein S18]-alanine N-acetyltransferase
VKVAFRPMTEADAHVVSTWRYPEPYSAYNGDANNPTIIAYLVDPANRIFTAVDESGEVVGFFSFGRDAQVPGGLDLVEQSDSSTLDIGLGLRPDLTGRGLGLEFLEAGMAFARKTFAPAHFRLAVLSWNERAIRVYERAGFQLVRAFGGHWADASRNFLLFTRDA